MFLGNISGEMSKKFMKKKHGKILKLSLDEISEEFLRKYLEEIPEGIFGRIPEIIHLDNS